MFAFKRLAQGVSSRCFNRQVVDLYLRVNIMNHFTKFGITQTSSQFQSQFYLIYFYVLHNQVKLETLTSKNPHYFQAQFNALTHVLAHNLFVI